jgi:hypothetical protein
MPSADLKGDMMPGKYEPPESGDAPQGVKDILQAAYQS